MQRWVSGRSLVLTAGVMAAAVALAACTSPTPAVPTGTASPSVIPLAFVNACAPDGPPVPTPTSRVPTPTPTPPPTPTKGPAISDYPPRLVVPPLPAPPVPARAQPLADALVSVMVYRPADYRAEYSNDGYHADGLIVSPGGLVLTVLDYAEPIGRIEVQVPGRGSFDATIERTDPRTSATLLKIDASAMPAAVLSAVASAAHGEPVVVLGQDAEARGVTSHDGYASLASYEPLEGPNFALLPIGYMGIPGSVVVNRDGAFVGMSGTWPWSGTGVYRTGGPAPGPSRPAVKASALRTLVEGRLEGADSTPAAVSYHGVGDGVWGTSLYWSAAPEALSRSVGQALRSVGDRADVGRLNGWARDVLAHRPGTVLELAYSRPQELRSADGTLLGMARHVAFWWSRDEGQPDVVLCGSEPGRFGAAFRVADLEPVRVAVEAAKTGKGQPTPLPVLPGYPFAYPLTVTVGPEKTEYRAGEVVKLIVTVENQSDWPMTAYNLPPPVEVRSQERGGPWWQAEAGSQTKTIAPLESLALEIAWWQADHTGTLVPPGGYCVSAGWATARGGTLGYGGPKACFTVLP